jgi:hypothetical protein
MRGLTMTGCPGHVAVGPGQVRQAGVGMPRAAIICLHKILSAAIAEAATPLPQKGMRR